MRVLLSSWGTKVSKLLIFFVRSLKKCGTHQQKRWLMRPATYCDVVLLFSLSFFQNEIADVDNEQRNQVIYCINQFRINRGTIFRMLSVQIHFHAHMDYHCADQKNIESTNHFFPVHSYHTSISQLLGFKLIGTVKTRSPFSAVAVVAERAAARTVTDTNLPLLT